MIESSLSDDDVLEQVADILFAVHNVSVGEAEYADIVAEGPLADLIQDIKDIVEFLSVEEKHFKKYEAELEQRLAQAEQQRETIRELSTPILEVWEGVLAVPILGIVDTMRASEIGDGLLTHIAEKNIRFVVIDLTGIDTMDTRTVFHFSQMARSSNLLGARCTLTGISPSVAHSVVQMGIDMTGLEIHRSLREALTAYLRAGGQVADSRPRSKRARPSVRRKEEPPPVPADPTRANGRRVPTP
jgi:rsbT co-antagonist protein RsbR